MKNTSVLSLGFLVALFFLHNLALAAPVGIITCVEGRVDVLKTGSAVPFAVSPGDSINPGDIYRAKSGSKAEVTFTDGNLVRMGPNTRVQVEEYTVSEEESLGVLRLYRGRVQTMAGRRASSGAVSRFEVHTENGVAAVVGSSMLVAHEKGITTASFLAGQGYLFSHQGPRLPVPVSAGYTSFLTSPFAGPTVPRPSMDFEIRSFVQQVTPTVIAGPPPSATPSAAARGMSLFVAGLGETAGTGFFLPPDRPSVTPVPRGTGDVFTPPSPWDATPPVVNMTPSSAPVAGTTTTDVTVGLWTNEPVTYLYRLNNGRWMSTGPSLLLPGLSPGPYTLDVRATDRAGNQSISSLPFVLGAHSVSGSVAGAGSVLILTGTATGAVATILGQNWGSWRMDMNGAYTGDQSPSWNTVAGGESKDSSNARDGYWIDKALGSYSGNSMTGTNSFTLLTKTTLARGVGTVMGSTNGGTLTLTDAGKALTETPLTFNGRFFSALSNYGRQGPLFPPSQVASGMVAGFLGGTEGLFTASTPVYLMGSYLKSSSYREPSLDSYALTNFTGGTTDSSSAFVGLSATVWNAGEIERGKMLALYVGPSGKTGYLYGDLHGEYLDAIAMWAAEGRLNNNQMGITSVLPGNLNSSLIFSTFSGNLYGSALSTTSLSASALHLSDQGSGIWKLGMGGAYDAVPSTAFTAKAVGQFSLNPYVGTDYGYWIGRVSTSDWGSPAASRFTASLTGRFLTRASLGDISTSYGGIVGTFADGAWQASGVGILENVKSLSFSGHVLTYLSPYTSYSPPTDLKSATGLVGGTGDLFAANVSISLMGEYTKYSSYREPALIYNRDPDIAGSTSDGSVAFSGHLSGIWNAGVIEKAKILALYVGPSGRAGYLYGDATGSYFDGSNMWTAEGILNSTQAGTTAIRPTNLASSLSPGTVSLFRPPAANAFVTSLTGTSSALSDQNWGIWNMAWEGRNTGSGPVFTAKVGGTFNFGVYGLDSAGYWLADFSTADWGSPAADRFTASLTGRFMTGTSMGDISTTYGGILGTVSGDTWKATGVGIYQNATPLSFGGSLFFSIEAYDSGDFSSGGWGGGGIGGTASFLQQNSPVYMMGWQEKFSSYREPSLMCEPFFSGGTRDGSAIFEGKIAAVISGNSIEKMKLLALYLGPSGQAGYLYGDASGRVFDEAGMWMAEGTLNHVQMATTNSLPPYGSNLNTSINFFGGSLSGSAIPASFLRSRLTAIDNRNWGIWNAEMGGTYSGLSSTWAVKAGGDICPFSSCILGLGEWFGDFVSTDWGTPASNRFSASLTGYFITPTELGHISTTYGGIIGTFKDGAWQAVGLGIYDWTPLSFVNGIDVTAGQGTSYRGYLGGVGSLFTASEQSPIAAVAMGSTPIAYPGDNLHVWCAGVYSYDFYNKANTTYDGGAYRGYLATARRNDTLSSIFAGLYIDPSGNAGYVKGILSGTVYSDITGWTSPVVGMFQMTGGLYPIPITTAATLPASLYDTYVTTSWTNPGPISGSGGFGGTGSISLTDLGHEYARLSEFTDWGIWAHPSLGGSYTGPASDTWNLSFDRPFNGYTAVIGAEITGTKWSDNKIVATAVGYGADIASTPRTWVSVGDLVGFYSPAPNTWQAVTVGPWIETNKFLQMAADLTPGGGMDKLKALHIPCVEVGRTDLRGAGGGIDLSSPGYGIFNATFFAATRGGAPLLWTSGNVSGAFTGNPSGQQVNLTGSTGITAQFNMQNWTTDKWLATISNGSAPSGIGAWGQSFAFKGGAAGTHAVGPSGSFSGTASGTAR